MAVVTDSRRHFSKTWHVTNVKNIARDDQATLMVDRNSANILFTFRFYACLRLRDRDWYSVADSNGRSYGLVPSFFDIKSIAGIGPAMTRIDRNSVITKIYAYEIKQDLLKKYLFAVRMPPLWFHCALFFSYCNLQRLLFSPMKNNFSTTLTPTEKPRYTYWRVFCRFYL